jgi:hypothetical protein
VAGAAPTPPAVPGFVPGTGPLVRVANVSWPRSGHGLLQRLLRARLGARFGYCERYGPERVPGTPCCAAFPCRRPDIHMTKEHDGSGGADLPPGHPLIVQIRDFLPAVVSHFELFLETNPGRDTAAGFRAFALPRAAAYRRFVAKWIDRPRDGRLILRYENLTAAPQASLAAVLRHVGAAEEPDTAAIAAAARITYEAGRRVRLAGHGVRAARDIAAFRFHDAALFDELATAALPDPRA